MADKVYSTYSSKGLSTLGTGLGYGVNEMAETALSMGIQNQRKTIIKGVTSNIENDFLNDVIQDGLGAGLGYVTGKAMQYQEEVLSSAFSRGSTMVGTWYAKSMLKNKFKGLKGRKGAMLSKFLGSSDKKAEECRIISDFVKMDIDSTNYANNPSVKHNMYESKIKYEQLEVNKEGVRSNIAGLRVTGMKETFDMKVKTSSFFNTDKKLIKQMTGLVTVTDKDIKKLNTLSANKVFQDSSGNWIGGNQITAELLNALNLSRL